MQLILGTPGNDAIAGTGLTDVIYGGAGDDTLYGGAGSDTLSGGPGADVVDFGDTLVRTATADVVTDFDLGDRIAFIAGPPAATAYQERVFDTQITALNYAAGEITSGRADVVAAQVGPDVFLYIDGLDRNVLSGLIRLQNADLSKLDVSSFVRSGAVPPTPSAPPTVPAPARHHVVAAVGTDQVRDELSRENGRSGRI